MLKCNMDGIGLNQLQYDRVVQNYDETNNQKFFKFVLQKYQESIQQNKPQLQRFYGLKSSGGIDDSYGIQMAENHMHAHLFNPIKCEREVFSSAYGANTLVTSIMVEHLNLK